MYFCATLLFDIRMAALINVETSTEVCSVALSCDGKVVWHKENFEGQNHSVLLTKYLDELMGYVKKEGVKVEGVAVSCGPGSYTGLRIGVSTCKGLCYGMDVPLIAVNTLQTMANHVVKMGKAEAGALLCPMIDARRMEVYTALFDCNLKQVKETSADIIDENSYLDRTEKMICFGNGANKCRKALSRENVEFLDDICPLAIDMVELSEKAYQDKEFQDVAYFEPFYLKEFIATVGKNKVFNQ